MINRKKSILFTTFFILFTLCTINKCFFFFFYLSIPQKNRPHTIYSGIEGFLRRYNVFVLFEKLHKEFFLPLFGQSMSLIGQNILRKVLYKLILPYPHRLLGNASPPASRFCVGCSVPAIRYAFTVSVFIRGSLPSTIPH